MGWNREDWRPSCWKYVLSIRLLVFCVSGWMKGLNESHFLVSSDMGDSYALPIGTFNRHDYCLKKSFDREELVSILANCLLWWSMYRKHSKLCKRCISAFKNMGCSRRLVLTTRLRNVSCCGFPFVNPLDVCVRPAYLFGVGIVLFSGSLYALVLTQQKKLGAITPIGGICFILGWTLMAFSGWFELSFLRLKCTAVSHRLRSLPCGLLPSDLRMPCMHGWNAVMLRWRGYVWKRGRLPAWAVTDTRVWTMLTNMRNFLSRWSSLCADTVAVMFISLLCGFTVQQYWVDCVLGWMQQTKGQQRQLYIKKIGSGNLDSQQSAADFRSQTKRL